MEALETEAEFLERNALADPDLLEPGADFSAYLKRTVPEALRRRAMRRLWRSNPVLANLDGLVDYDADYTNAAAIPGPIATAYQVGRGFAKLPASLETDDATPPPEAAGDGEPAGTEHMSDVDAEGVPDALVPDPTPDEVPSMGGPAAAADPAEGHGSEEATEVVSARTGPAPSVADSTPVLARARRMRFSVP